MSIRHLVVASLLVSAGAAQADVVSSATQPGFQSGWTTGNGSSVIGSGVLGSGVSLVGGVAHNASSDLTSTLVGKASASLSQSDAQKLFVQQGIDASYVLSAGNGLLAARYGNSVSVINDGDGVKIVPGQDGSSVTAPVAGGAVGGATGGGAAVGGSAPVSGGGSAGGSTGGSAGGSTPVSGGSGSVDVSLPPVSGDTGTDVGGGNAALPDGTDIGGGNAGLPVSANPGIALPELAAEVPEPSTIALMLAGVMGAGFFGRRRKAK